MPSLTQPNRPRRRTRRGEELRLRIIAEAASLFLEHGYDGVSLADILKQVGGSKTNFYTFFGDKEGLFIESMNALITDLLVPIRTPLPAADSLAEALSAFGRKLLAILLSPRHIAYQRLVIAMSARQPSVGCNWFRHGPELTHRALERILLHFQNQGAVRRDLELAPAAVLFHDMIVFDLLFRTMLSVAERPGESDIERRVGQAVQVFLAGIGAKEVA
jgi:AcrR family transcriptional regulator